MADARYGLANRIANQAVTVTGKVGRDLTDRTDRVVLNRALGIPIFLVMMYLMFMFTIAIGGAFIDFFDQLTGVLIVDGFAEVLGAVGSPEWLTMLLASGIGGGLQTVATFIPVIGFLYLFLSVLEDSGYMARAAFVMDRFMRGPSPAGMAGERWIAPRGSLPGQPAPLSSAIACVGTLWIAAPGSISPDCSSGTPPLPVPNRRRSAHASSSHSVPGPPQVQSRRTPTRST